MAWWRQSRLERDLLKAIPERLGKPVSLPEILGSKRLLAVGESALHQDPGAAVMTLSQMRALYDAGVRYLFLESPHHESLDRLNAGEMVSVRELSKGTRPNGQMLDLTVTAASLGIEVFGADQLRFDHGKLLVSNARRRAMSPSQRAAHDKASWELFERRDEGMAGFIRSVMGDQPLEGDSHPPKGIFWGGGFHILQTKPGIPRRLEKKGISTSALIQWGGMVPNDELRERVFSSLDVKGREFAVPVMTDRGPMTYLHVREAAGAVDQLEAIVEPGHEDIFVEGVAAGDLLSHYLLGRYLLEWGTSNDALQVFAKGSSLGDAWQSVEYARTIVKGIPLPFDPAGGRSPEGVLRFLESARDHLVYAADVAHLPGTDRLAAAYIERISAPYFELPGTRDLVSDLRRKADEREASYPHPSRFDHRAEQDVPEQSSESAPVIQGQVKRPRRRVSRLLLSSSMSDDRADERSIDSPTVLGRMENDGADRATSPDDPELDVPTGLDDLQLRANSDNTEPPAVGL